MKEHISSAPVTEVTKAETKTTAQIVTDALDRAQAERRNRWDKAAVWSATALAVGAATVAFAKYVVPSAGLVLTESVGAVFFGAGVVGVIASNIGNFVDSPRKRHVAPAHA